MFPYNVTIRELNILKESRNRILFLDIRNNTMCSNSAEFMPSKCSTASGCALETKISAPRMAPGGLHTRPQLCFSPAATPDPAPSHKRPCSTHILLSLPGLFCPAVACGTRSACALCPHWRDPLQRSPQVLDPPDVITQSASVVSIRLSSVCWRGLQALPGRRQLPMPRHGAPGPAEDWALLVGNHSLC